MIFTKLDTYGFFVSTWYVSLGYIDTINVLICLHSHTYMANLLELEPLQAPVG